MPDGLALPVIYVREKIDRQSPKCSVKQGGVPESITYCALAEIGRKV